MPFRKSARLTATNESARKVGAFYSNIDYQLVPSLPDDTLYFHAQYRQATPNTAHTESDKNPDGRHNYVYVETRGRGHLMGVTLGVLQNTDHWMGEGDDMIFIDDETQARDHRHRFGGLLQWRLGFRWARRRHSVRASL